MKKFLQRKPKLSFQHHKVHVRLEWNRYQALKSTNKIYQSLMCLCLSNSVHLCPQRMDARYQTTAAMEAEGAEFSLQLAHKTPPRVPPKPTSKSPTQATLVSKVTIGRQQSPSPVRPVKAPLASPVRWVELQR